MVALLARATSDTPYSILWRTIKEQRKEFGCMGEYLSCSDGKVLH
jgi:hypothetical protein